MTDNLLILAAAVLLPLIPAYILYRFLPSKAVVRGPFQGLTVQLTGAFGGYFLVMLSAFGFYHTLPDNTNKMDDEVWTIRGKVGTAVPNPRHDLRLSVLPTTTQVDDDETFMMRILVTRNQNGPQLPTLIVEHPLFEPVDVHFPAPGAPPPDCATQLSDKDKTIYIPDTCLHLTKKEAPPPGAFVTQPEPVPEK